ncbi:hypothetical protein SAMN05518865_103313 [Duganella sp. CF458]|uniref:hypothetical protein n=1 Tax=Duganella sp. CF458 TaxID=1884368 RepID=UPI0008E32C98|nr:hypothetical protein [Duganella sp. CF458]SFF70621.1 hypothetical protein SAMN05518865_103313 [Duganella sp. CF458]
MMRLLARRGAACAALLLLMAAASVYPAPRLPLAILLSGYMALLLWRPQAWLLAVPALLPVLDFAPWTGWFFLEELDLLLLATCAGGYWAVGGAAAPTKLPGLARGALGLFVLCYLVAAWRGMMPLAPLDANSFANYTSPYNGLRVLKGVLWPLVLLPLLRATAGAQGSNLQRLLVPGMILGLAACSLAVVWERMAFPGLFNFSSDYRPTAPFSAMHTGGAALDAYLAMAFPFVTLWLVNHPPPRRLALGLAALGLGLFAGLTTFSRDIYLAYTAAGAVIVVLGSAHHLRGGTLSARSMLASLLLLLLSYWVLSQVFAHGGYRGLGAALGLLATALLLGGAAPRLAQRPAAAGLGLVLLLLVGLIGMLGSASPLAKGPYLAYAIALLCAAGGAALLAAGPAAQRPWGVLLLAAALPAQALAAALVARHYGGNAALPGIALAILLALAMGASRLLPQRPWKLERGTLTVSFFSAIVFAALIPISSSYYTGSRFATVGNDLTVRVTHWSDALAMMDDTTMASVFGQGLGRFPLAYMWQNTHGEVPGTFSYVDEPGNRFLLLGAAQYARGWGEVLRMLQHVDVQPGQHYRFTLDIRRNSADALPVAMVCQRWLIYPQDCSVVKFKAPPLVSGWQRVEGELPLRGARGNWGAPLVLELYNRSHKAPLEVDNVSLVEAGTQRELLRNGSFSGGNDFWFFSSDRNHMPWHVKNFAVNQLFELGWVGALATAFLLLALGGRMVARGLAGDSYAAVSLAALTGCMMVGLFDSITDVPRLTIVFLLIALAGSLKPARQRIKVRRRRAEAEDEGADTLPA